ncbi:hypothetical protein BTO05_08705 [Winogradskyella sp. PC-19]|uniref:DUF4175 family protein n=1 Tax=unclassified Winogradskyella TaxID=2615021 RepID=UPI000B3CC965|nr:MULTISPECIES: DUF4175 family protein [unclassified Winogradskyella]ARV09718.1 hypothetical protein BTO05_08705 [Winogradskyella sp. PC-19]RZN81397.1 MAG: hypothetical protein EVB12_03815 [Winogradskyella sp.]
MSNFKTIQVKLQQFIKKFYTNELLKGAILFFAIGVLYLMITLLIEYLLWLNPTARTILFWAFIAVELALFTRFIIIPLAKLFNLRKGIDYETASKLIGNHFPEVDDKLLNVLQLNQNNQQSDLLLASIEQKSAELKPIPFQMAINFKSSLKYLKYAAIPVVILLLSFITGKINWFSDSYERVVNYQTAYEPPAPFQFFVVNDKLRAIENKDFTLIVKTVGNIIPDQVQIDYKNQTYFLQQNIPGEFQYVFSQPKEDITFSLLANDVVSKAYELNVVNVPTLVGFDMILDYPNHTQKRDEILKSTGSAVIPEGTNITWSINTKSTSDVNIYSNDTISFTRNDSGVFEASKRLYRNYSYSINTSNENLTNYESLAFSINVVKDAYPELNIKVEKDSVDQQSLYFYGQVSDDYGLRKLQLVYYSSDNETQKKVIPINISKSNFSEFVSAFPDQLDVKDGVAYNLYFEVFDNDAIHNFKNVKSTVFSYRKRTRDEEETKQLNEQNETIKNISKTFEKLEEQDKKLEELSKTQKEKEALNFNDKKKFEEFLKRQKQQEQLMKNFNKKLQKNLEEFQKEKDEKGEKDEFKEDLKERLKENEEQLKKDEKLLEELEKMTEKINKEEFSQKLEELAKQNKNKKRSMQQLLELTKRFYVTQKQQKIQKELEEISKKQEELSEKSPKENTKEAQEKLNKEFKEIQKAIDELMSENRKLRKPEDIERDKPTEESIKEDQKEAKESLEKSEPQKESEMQKAKNKQKAAAKKMKQLGKMMKQSMMSGGGGGPKIEEDVEMLRQILDNLVLFSFDQEDLMERFNEIDINHNQYGKFIIKQSTLKEHFEHVDDSLFALSLRNPKISEKINSQITDVYFNIDKSLGQLTENRIYQGVSSQQYTVTAANSLANMLSNILDNMEMSMNMQPGQGGEGEMQLPDIIMSQEELNKKMEEAMKKMQEGEKPGEGEKGEKGEKEGEEGKDGEKGKKEGESGQEGQQGKSGEKGGQESGGKEGEGKQGEGNQGENGKEGKGSEGKNGKDGKNGKNGDEDGEGEKNDGYGEGGSEEFNGELYKIYQQQQKLRQALQDKIGKEGSQGNAGDLIKQMEEVELDLINKGFTNQTLQKMMDLQHQLLKMENATFTQGEDEKRESKTNRKEYNSKTNSQIPTAKQYFNTTEILNRQALPLRSQFKKKLQDYFKSTND